MKKLIAATLLVSSLLMIASCGRESEDELRLQAYYDALEVIFETRICPDDFELGWCYSSPDDYHNNDYAIYDVDCDGAEELIVRWMDFSASLASLCMRVYEYNPTTNEWILELSSQKDAHFYDDGTIVVDSIRNQSHGLMCPYYLYHYDENSNSYPAAYMVWSWDLIHEYEEGYPYNVDTENEGTVYYVTYYSLSNHQHTGTPMIMNIGNYEAFYYEHVGHANEVDVGFMPWGEGLPN